jgi:hypothetical protein
MNEAAEDKGESFEGGRYAGSEEELFDKAVALLDKCKVMSGSSDRDGLESAARPS